MGIRKSGFRLRSRLLGLIIDSRLQSLLSALEKVYFPPKVWIENPDSARGDGGADAGPAYAGGPGESEDHGRIRKEGGALSGIVMLCIGTDNYIITKDSAGQLLRTRF